MIFKTEIYQENNSIIAHVLYKDLIYAVDKEKEIKNVKYLNRIHPLQHILNATSVEYISPSAMKSFQLCPAAYLYHKLVPQRIGSAVSIGSSFHKIMERWYNNEERTLDNLKNITNEVIQEDQQFLKEDEIKFYVDGYLEANDYIDDKPMNHSKLDCTHELFLKPKIKPLGVDLGVPVYLKLDRLDLRENGIYIIDYKIGKGDPNPYLLGINGYLPQLIFYKWGIEAEYGEKIKDAYLCLPGASKKFKYVKMNVHSLVEQSKVIEESLKYIEEAQKIRETMVFPQRINRYCISCEFKYKCQTYVEYKNLPTDNIVSKEEICIDY